MSALPGPLPTVDRSASWRPVDGPPRRAAHAAAVRTWLEDLWRAATDGHDTQGMALALVGSFARQEAGPHSDLDLVLLHDRGARATGIGEVSDRLWYPLWDAGIRFDHSVRTVAECRTVAATDLSAAVGLLDMRLVAGDEGVVTEAVATVAADWRKAARGRLGEVLDVVSARHTRFGDAAHMLAPDLKEARGGLRDMTVLRALTAAWLADRPHGGVDTAYQRLLDVRDALHVVTGKHRERLDRELVAPVGEVLGLSEPDDVLREVYGAAREVAHAFDLTLRRARQSQAARRLRIGPRRPQLTPLGHGLFEHDGDVVFGAKADQTEPLLMSLRAAAVASRTGHPLAPATVAHLARSLREAPAPLPWDAAAREAMGDLLAAGPALVTTWETLDIAGVVAAWLPEWDLVRCRPQHSPVHRHTVDRHALECVVKASGLIRRVPRPDLLLVAALLHDLGKGVASLDHPAAGERIAAGILDRWGMPSADAAIVLTLVREHLTLAELATRRDPSDPATVDALAAAVGHDGATLNLLHALTIADAAAVGGHAWNEWRSRLIAGLVAVARARLSGAAASEEMGATIPDAVAGSGLRCVVEREGPTYRVLLGAPDRLGLFADVAGLLSVSGHGVRSASLRTVDGRAVQEWHVDADGGAVPDAAGLVRRLDRLTEGDRTPLARLDRVPETSAAVQAALPAVVELVKDASATATVVQVRGTDRRGLLHDIGQAVADTGVCVRSAHVETYAGQTLDTFYVTTATGGQLAGEQAQAVLTAIGAAADRL